MHVLTKKNKNKNMLSGLKATLSYEKENLQLH